MHGDRQHPNLSHAEACQLCCPVGRSNTPLTALLACVGAVSLLQQDDRMHFHPKAKSCTVIANTPPLVSEKHVNFAVQLQHTADCSACLCRSLRPTATRPPAARGSPGWRGTPPTPSPSASSSSARCSLSACPSPPLPPSTRAPGSCCQLSTPWAAFRGQSSPLPGSALPPSSEVSPPQHARMQEHEL